MLLINGETILGAKLFIECAASRLSLGGSLPGFAGSLLGLVRLLSQLEHHPIGVSQIASCIQEILSASLQILFRSRESSQGKTRHLHIGSRATEISARRSQLSVQRSGLLSRRSDTGAPWKSVSRCVVRITIRRRKEIKQSSSVR